MFVAAPDIASGDPSDLLTRLRLNFAPIMPSASRGAAVPPKATAAELLASVSDFTDPPSVNRFLGNLIKLVAVKRIPRKNAVALACISQLILNSQAAQDRRELMRLQIAKLDAQRQKSLPARVIWDLPVRRKPPQEQEAQEANAAKLSRPKRLSRLPCPLRLLPRQPKPMTLRPITMRKTMTDADAPASSGSARAQRLPPVPHWARLHRQCPQHRVRRGSSCCASRPT